VASVSRDPKCGVYRVHFRFGVKQYQKSLKTTDGGEAEAMKGRIEETLLAIDKGWLTPPADPDAFWPFVFSGGKLESKPTFKEVLTLERLFAKYEEHLPPGTLEDNSLETHKLHKEHLLRIFGAKQTAQALTTTDLQGYINKRARETYRGRHIQAGTIKKEVATFRVVWNWGVLHNLLTGNGPVRGLKYEKAVRSRPS
jgi:hypothetical protein